MTNIPTTTTRFAETDFRVGRVISRSLSVLSRNLLTFAIVTGVAYLPTLLLTKGAEFAASGSGAGIATAALGGFLLLVLSIVSQAVIVHAAFQDMRGRPIRLGESISVGLGRFFPIIGLAIVMAILVGIGFVLLVIPGLILLTMWFVGTPVCVVERKGPLASLGRSSELTKGHRWKIFGLMLLLILISAVISPLIDVAFLAVAGLAATFVVSLIWNALWGAFYAIAVVVAYHDLRAAKEGIDIEQIAAVFD
jgi:hypothetical protein